MQDHSSQTAVRLLHTVDDVLAVALGIVMVVGLATMVVLGWRHRQWLLAPPPDRRGEVREGQTGLLAWVALLPTTNWNQFVTAVMMVQLVLAVEFLVLVGRPPQEGVLWPIVGLLMGKSGVDVFQYRVKRKTHDDAPPANPDVEDASAMADEEPRLEGQ